MNWWIVGRKQPKQQWNMDTKVGKTSFDDLFDEHPEETKVVTKKKEGTTDARQTWGSMGLRVSECVCVHMCFEVHIYFFNIVKIMLD